MSTGGLPNPSMAPTPHDKAAIADIGKGYLGWVQMVSDYHAIKSKVNNTSKHHHDINITTNLLSSTSIFTVSDVNKVIQKVLVKGKNT